MTQFNFNSHRALIRIKKRFERFARRPFDHADEPRRAQDCRHAVGGEVNDVFRADGESKLANRSNRRTGFHSMRNP